MAFLAALASAAAILSGHQPAVTCAAPDAYGGVYYPATAVIALSPGNCAKLEQFIVAGKLDVTEASALLAFTHESMHASLLPGWTDETLTECRAIAEVDVTAALLIEPLRLDPVVAGRVIRRVYELALEAHRALFAHDPVYGNRPCAGITA